MEGGLASDAVDDPNLDALFVEVGQHLRDPGFGAVLTGLLRGAGQPHRDRLLRSPVFIDNWDHVGMAMQRAGRRAAVGAELLRPRVLHYQVRPRDALHDEALSVWMGRDSSQFRQLNRFGALLAAKRSGCPKDDGNVSTDDEQGCVN